ncbi:MAG: helix-turn-helix transcriptional regulator, partial [Lachnospiraceae bacterium]|nr:helix-turn-helix transcriptional regulator [Lachnospiraceae bacterium]
LPQSCKIFAYRGAYAPLLSSYFGGSQGHSPTFEQAHVGSDLLTLVSYNFNIDIPEILFYNILSNTKHMRCYMNDKYERQMKKGVLDMLVLKLLESEAKYGYQIIQEMKEKSEDIFLLKDGTLYPILYRLEDEGMVVSKWSEAVGKQVPRKYYEITETGKSALKSIEEIWKSISRGIIKIMEE